MFKRYCDCCGKEVALRILRNANEPGVVSDGRTILVRGVKLNVGLVVKVEGNGNQTDLCAKCAKQAVLSAVEFLDSKEVLSCEFVSKLSVRAKRTLDKIFNKNRFTKKQFLDVKKEQVLSTKNAGMATWEEIKVLQDNLISQE